MVLVLSHSRSHTFIITPSIVPSTLNPSIPPQNSDSSIHTTQQLDLHSTLGRIIFLCVPPLYHQFGYCHRSFLDGFCQSLTGQLRRPRPDPAVSGRYRRTVQRSEQSTFNKVPYKLLVLDIPPLLHHLNPANPILFAMLSSYGLIQSS